MFWEILLTLLAVLALAALGGALRRKLVCPVRGVRILIPAEGDAQELEYILRGLRTLSDQGQLESEAIYLADAGLSREGRAAAERLCRQFPGVRLCGETDWIENESP
ncbi:MAG: hypothetical protein IJ751_00360 [Oscillospiraceae bacterium]|nr:hypothetical protein [Oscillospiraceae bacterium]